VFKVGGKMFLLSNLQNPVSVNLKCDPERAVILREEFDEITPGYHMNKVHWNSVNITGRLSETMLLALVDHSYNLVYNTLPKNLREQLQGKVS
jgi:predicted DNA-binding protein (MmcQ/YjbR family)